MCTASDASDHAGRHGGEIFLPEGLQSPCLNPLSSWSLSFCGWLGSCLAFRWILEERFSNDKTGLHRLPEARWTGPHPRPESSGPGGSGRCLLCLPCCLHSTFLPLFYKCSFPKYPLENHSSFKSQILYHLFQKASHSF